MSDSSNKPSADVPFVGIVTVLYNSDDVLPDFFTSLAAQRDIRFRVYVIDNSATDSGTRMSHALAQQYGIDADCVFNNANVGVAMGNNQGIVKALDEGCTHVLLLNNDTVFNSDLLTKLVTLTKGGTAEMAVPKMMFFDDKHKIWCAGGRFNRYRAMSPVHFGEGETDQDKYNRYKLIDYAPTCCVLIKREVFERIGLMDSNYFVYYDDVDFMFRARLAEIKMAYIPRAVLYHKVGSLTGGKHSDFVIRFSTRNKVYFIMKHYGGLESRLWIKSYSLLFRIRLLTGLDSRNTYNNKLSAFKEGKQLYQSVSSSKVEDFYAPSV